MIIACNTSITEDTIIPREEILRELSMKVGEEFFNKCNKSGVLYPYECNYRPEVSISSYNLKVSIIPIDEFNKIYKRLMDIYHTHIEDDNTRNNINEIIKYLKWDTPNTSSNSIS